MMMARSSFCCLRFILWILIAFNSNSIPGVNCWDNEDFEIFDLVEEVNANFYELFGIGQTAKTSEVRKAYRKLSLQYHPDKNSADDAEEKFRQIVAIYEVLKDEKKREKYDQVLVEGLPDWKQPVFYYRRARKMGLLELFFVLAIIITIGQYFVAWAIYIERRLVVEEILSSKKKKEKKKKKQATVEVEYEEEDELKSIPTPRLLDLWPFQLIVFTYFTVYNLPTTIKEWKEERERRKEEEEELARALTEELNSQPEEIQRKPKKRAPIQLPEYSNEVYASIQSSSASHKGDDDSDKQQRASQSVKKGDWTDEELVLLSKAVNKYPGGTLHRWEKIAVMVGRTAAEVTAKAKETKGSYSMNLSTDVQSSSFAKSVDHMVSDTIITQNSSEEAGAGSKDSQALRKRNKPTKVVKTAEKTLLLAQVSQAAPSDQEQTSQPESQGNSGGCVAETGLASWTQNQQTIFEWALKQFPKGTDKRWHKIAEHIPGKSKEDCMARFKLLAELVSKKKKLEQDTKTS